MFANTNGEIYNYTYNADGIRTQKNVFNANGDFTGSTEYIYDGTKLIAENRGGDWLYYFYDANSTVTGMYYNNVLYYFRKNLQGDITGIYNATGTLVVEYEYTPYGAILSTTGSMATTIGTINPFRYRGYYYDTETELYYLITRYYDPEVGRFLNADVYVSTGQGILGNNMFAYCGNNPVVRIDENGQLWLTTFITVTIFASIIAAPVIMISEPIVPDAVCEAGKLYLNANNYNLSSLMFEHAFIGNGDKFTENNLSEDLTETLKDMLLDNEDIKRIITNMSNKAKSRTV